MQLLLKDYNDKCLTSISANIKLASIRQSSSYIHKLRLSIKRFNILIDLLEAYENTILEDKQIKNIRYIFLQCGKLRDLQIENTILKNIKNDQGVSCKSLSEWIKSKRKNKKNILSKTLKKKSEFELVLLNQRINELLEKIDGFQLYNNCRTNAFELISEFNRSVNIELDDTTLHRLRTIIKNIVYTNILLRNNKQELIIEPQDLKYLNILQQKIGRWHDYYLFHKRISQFSQQKNKLKKINAILENEKNKLKSSIILSHEIIPINITNWNTE